MFYITRASKQQKILRKAEYDEKKKKKFLCNFFIPSDNFVVVKFKYLKFNQS